MLVHEVTEALPDTTKFVTPIGAAALIDPVTTAVKRTEPPSVGTADAVRTTVGVVVATVVVVVEAMAETEL
jgi:hypothetical protein